MAPTYTYPTNTQVAQTSIDYTSDPYRRRKVAPLMATPYLRYRAFYVPGNADVLLSPPFWTFWSRWKGNIVNVSMDSLLKSTGFLADDPIYGPLCPVTPYNSMSVVQNELLSQIKKQTLNLAVSVAEGKQTLSFLANTTRRLALAAEALRKRDYAAFRRSVMDQGTAKPPTRMRIGGDGKLRPDAPQRPNLKRPRDRLPETDSQFHTRTASENWLAYQYAVMPLLYDIHGAAEYIAEIIHRDPPPVYMAKTSFSDNIGKEFTTASSAQNVSVSWTAIGEVRHTSALFFRVDDAALRQAARNGITNPASVLWEKTKFSFLIDWLIPVGEFLSGWDAPLGCTLIDGYATTHLQCTLTGTPTAQFLKSTILSPTTPSELLYDGWVRKTVKVFPYPSPRVKNPFSTDHLATAVALVRVLCGKPRVP